MRMMEKWDSFLAENVEAGQLEDVGRRRIVRVRKDRVRLEAVRATERDGESRIGEQGGVFTEEDMRMHGITELEEGFNVLWDEGSEQVIGIVNYRYVQCPQDWRR
jgi:hypothetical protein